MWRAKRNLLIGILAAGLLVGAVWIWANRQFVQDWIVVGQYTATDEVAEIAKRAGMSNKGVFVFYANEPEVSDAVVFNQQCQRREVGAAILGCYTAGRIFIYRVTSPELDGIKEVTAAHEMLHAAWERLSEAERGRLGTKLEQVYERIKTPELDQRIGYYDRQQPGERINELHSIIGTEVADLDDYLEDHYSQYFDERRSLVALHSSYESVFRQLREEAKTLSAELESSADKINSEVASYNRAVDDLNEQIVDHNQTLATVNRSDRFAVNAYNQRQNDLRDRQNQLRQQKRSIDRMTKEYDSKLKTYNALVVRNSNLTAGIDSVLEQTKLAE